MPTRPSPAIALLILALLVMVLRPEPSRAQLSESTLPKSSEAKERRTRFSFEETDALVANPGEGWLSASSPLPNAPGVPSTVSYLRFDWADVAPADGVYDWSLIDRALAAASARGATLGLRVMTANAHSRGTYSSPKWLFDMGCKSYGYTPEGNDPTVSGSRIARIEPDYADALYLQKHGAFLQALGARYNGNPDIAFLDIGSYGIWGEWHTTHPVSAEVRQKIVDLYLGAFPNTPLVFMTDDAETLPYALAHGIGMRRDGVGSPWHADNWIGSKRYASVAAMADAWKTAPVVFEWYGDYRYLQSRHWSFASAVQFMLDNHVTLINDNIGEVPPEDQESLRTLARRAGYRFVLRSGSYVLQSDRQLDLEMLWANTGVGKLYQHFELQLALIAPNGQRVRHTSLAVDPRTWLAGDHSVKAVWNIPPELASGNYALAVALVDPEHHFPPLQLAINRAATDGWTPIGHLHLP